MDVDDGQKDYRVFTRALKWVLYGLYTRLRGIEGECPGGTCRHLGFGEFLVKSFSPHRS